MVKPLDLPRNENQNETIGAVALNDKRQVERIDRDMEDCLHLALYCMELRSGKTYYQAPIDGESKRVA